ncbi:MAG: ATP-binding protein [bacterium]|nr:ATP-binding protein [bacterium]
MSQKAVSNSTPIVPESNTENLGPTDLITQVIKAIDQLDKKDGPGKQSQKLWQLLAELSSSGQLLDSGSELSTNLISKIVSYFGADRGLYLETDRLGRARIVAGIGFDQNRKLKELHLANSISARVLEDRHTIAVDQKVERPNERALSRTPSVLCAPVGSGRFVPALLYLERDGVSGGFGKEIKLQLEIVTQWLLALRYKQPANPDGDSKPLELDGVTASIPLGLIITDSAGNIRLINQMAGEILDLNLKEIKETAGSNSPTSIWELLPNNQTARWQYLITTALTTNEPVHDPRFQMDTGYMEKTLSIRISSCRSGSQALSTGAIITLSDNSEQSILDDYIILSEKLAARGEFADEVAREFDQQLSSLSTTLSQLNDSIDKAEWEKVKFSGNLLSRAVLKMQFYTASLTDLSRPATEFMTYDLKALIEDELFSLRHQIQFKQIHFSIEMDQDLPMLEIDVYQMQRLLRDLLENAAHATEQAAIEAESAGKEFRRKIGIQVQYLETDEKVILEISDNGPGLERSEVERIFQLHYTTKTNAHGLGLYNCQRTVRQHHGKIVVGDNEDQGTIFTVILPRFQPRAVENKKKKSD